jgi:hypothetical protein
LPLAAEEIIGLGAVRPPVEGHDETPGRDVVPDMHMRHQREAEAAKRRFDAEEEVPVDLLAGLRLGMPFGPVPVRPGIEP